MDIPGHTELMELIRKMEFHARAARGDPSREDLEQIKKLVEDAQPGPERR